MIELCCEYLTVRCIWLCYHQVTYACQSESTLYRCLNVKPGRSESQVMFLEKGSVLLSRSWTSQYIALCDDVVMSSIDTFSNTRSRETDDWRKNKKRSSKTIGLMLGLELLKIAKDDKARLKQKLLTPAVRDNGVKTDVAVVVVVYP